LKFQENPLDPTSPTGLLLYFLKNQQEKEYLIGTDKKNVFVIDLETNNIYFKNIINSIDEDILLSTQSDDPSILYFLKYNNTTYETKLSKFNLISAELFTHLDTFNTYGN